jgi:hypothetical protein
VKRREATEQRPAIPSLTTILPFAPPPPSFGKLVEIHFNQTHHICGARIRTYLLEKSRVVGPLTAAFECSWKEGSGAAACSALLR